VITKLFERYASTAQRALPVLLKADESCGKHEQAEKASYRQARPP